MTNDIKIKKFKYRGSNPLEHFDLRPADFDIYQEVDNIRMKIVAEVVDKTDTAICNAIINAAREEGVTDLYLIDREFVISAIKNEIARRKGKGEMV